MRQRLRLAMVLAAGAMVVHQLRYLTEYGAHTHQALIAQGHSYLPGLFPSLGMLTLGLVAATALSAVFRDRPEGAATWGAPACTVAILAIFCGQELIEGFVAAGHPGGIAAILANGGLMAAPVSLLVGCLCSVLLGGLHAVEEGLRRVIWAVPATPRRRDALPQTEPESFIAHLPASRPLGFGLARRPPPALAV